MLFDLKSLIGSDTDFLVYFLDELEQISNILPDRYNGGVLQESGRITQGAALALRARAAFYFDNFSEAEKSAKAVIESGRYAL